MAGNPNEPPHRAPGRGTDDSSEPEEREAPTPEHPAPQETGAAKQEGGEAGGISGRLTELSSELEEAEKREADLLGAVNVNRARMDRLKGAIDAIEEELEQGREMAPIPGIGKLEVPGEVPSRPQVPAAPAIEVRNLRKQFQMMSQRAETLKEQVLHPFRTRHFTQIQALDDLSFDVAPGEFLGVAGPNGSGKSTLLKILASIYTADSGTVRVAGRL